MSKPESEDAWSRNLRSRKSIATSSRSMSKPNSRSVSPPVVSPNRYAALQNETDPQESRNCQKCEVIFTNPDDKMIECKRCTEFYCIKCLGKSEEEYRFMTLGDVMWFCGTCREKVERNIIQDRELEEKCKDIMKSFETRINDIETAVAEKCSKEETKKLINEELDKRLATKTIEDNPSSGKPAAAATTATATGSNINEVLQEMNRRKSRENNIIIYGIEESGARTWQERSEHDHKQIQNVMKVLEVDLPKAEIEKVTRCGKFNKEKFVKDKKSRPLLVVMKTNEKKGSMFKAVKKLKDNPSTAKVSIANDLTKAEKEQEKLMFEQAKVLTNQSSGEFKFRVTGPPWARKIIKVAVEPEKDGANAASEED